MFTAVCYRLWFFGLHFLRTLTRLKPSSYFLRMRSEFDVNLTSGQPFAAIFAIELNRAELLRIFVAIFVTSIFASHSHSQEV